MTFTLRHVAILLLAAVSLAPTALATRILDLSEDFKDGNTNSQAAVDLVSLIATDGRDVRRLLILEDGEIVLEYQRDNVPDEKVYNLWSVTKSVTSLLLGVAIESGRYNFSFDETLEEIFVDNTDAWKLITNETELAYKKSVTVIELLTMTSGMTPTYTLNPFNEESINLFAMPSGIANSAGADISESLSFPDILPGMRGSHHYLAYSNILSYVIKEKTGMTPLEFMNQEVSPFLGIDETQIKWDTNEDGIETSFSNLYLTNRQMAKFGQLYLQRGFAAPNVSIVSEDWINASLTGAKGSENMFGPDGLDGAMGYGYLWYNYTTEDAGQAYCALGNHGQTICFNYETKRVIAFQRSNTLWDIQNMILYVDFMLGYFTPNITFEGQAVSGAVSSSFSGVALFAAAASTISLLSGVVGWF